MTLDLDKLEELAKKATSGKRRAMRQGNQYYGVKSFPIMEPKLCGASVVEGLVRPWNPYAALEFGVKAEQHEEVRLKDADADLVAALDPDTVLSLIAEARAGRKLAAGLRLVDTDFDEVHSVRWGVVRAHLLPAYDAATKGKP